MNSQLNIVSHNNHKLFFKNKNVKISLLKIKYFNFKIVSFIFFLLITSSQ